MAALDLSAPPRLPYNVKVTLGLANVAQLVTLPAHLDCRVTFRFVTNDGLFSTDPTVTDGGAIDAAAMPVDGDAPQVQDFVGPGHVTSFAVASGTGSTVLYMILERAPTNGAK